ncbi:AAA family ATPase [Pseudomonas putida]|uniref:AAA family ATPase n=1 Tax=Pseudomonas putida TaxID=303 RepID=UPI0013C491DE|nr:AAA family ATPase [Pseudomonas putida]
MNHLHKETAHLEMDYWDLLWLTLMFSCSRLRLAGKLRENEARGTFVDFLRDKLRSGLKGDIQHFESFISLAADKQLILLDELLDRIFDEISQARLVDFSVFIIDTIISLSFGYALELPRIHAEIIRGVTTGSDCKNIVDVFPANAEYSIRGTERSDRESYLVRRDNAESALVKLKLELTQSSYHLLGERDIFTFNSDGSTFVIDIDQKDKYGQPVFHGRRGTFAFFQELLNARKDGGLVIISRQPLKVIQPHLVDLLSSLMRRVSIKCIIKFPSPRKTRMSAGLAIVAQIDSRGSNGQDWLYIDVTRSEAIPADLNALERARLAADIYQLWARKRVRGVLEKSTTRRIMSSLFEGMYRDVDGLCMAKKIAEDGRLELDPWKRLDAAKAEAFRPSALINSKPILEQLQRSQHNKCFYVIGNNGEGKSFLLRDIIHLMAERNQKTTSISISHADRFPISTDVKGESYSNLGLISGANSNSLSSRSEACSSSIIRVMKNKTKANFLLKALAELGFAGKIYLVKQSKSKNYSTSSGSVFSLTGYREKIELSAIDPKKFELGLVARGEDRIVSFKEFSSGERNVLQLVVLLTDAADPDTTFFIDEPEISLHVKWQQILPKLFSRLAEYFGLSLVVATHSPVMIANADFDNSECYIAREGILELIDSKDRHSVETILLQGFKTYTPHNREVHEKCAKLVSNIVELVNTDSANAREAGGEAIKELRGIDAIIRHTGQNRENAQERGDLELLAKAITAIRSVIRVE